MDVQNHQQKLILVEYPGVVKNTDKMIKTLGGINQISEVFNMRNGRLPVKFHPENVYSKSAMADQTPGTGMLLKVIVRRPKDRSSKKPVITKSVTVLGHVENTFRFKTMCDYQYLPVKQCPTTKERICVYNQIMPTGIVGAEWLTQVTSDVEYFMPPSFFARVDTSTRLFRKEVPKTTTDTTEEDKYSELIGRTRTRFRKPAYYLPFSLTNAVPVRPSKYVSSSEFLMLKFVTVEQFNQVKELFEQRPIMTKMYISYKTQISDEKLKYIMPMLSYYYTTGPWRIMWVRFGYDPRKDFESRYYQRLDYRARLYVGMRKQKNASESFPTLKQRARPYTKKEERKDRVYYPYFECDQLPQSLQCIYQYCDIRVPRIQEMLDKIPTPLSGATCNEKSGWLPTNFDDQCREILTDIVKRLLASQRKDANESIADDDEEEEIYSEEGEDDIMEQDDTLDYESDE